MHLEARYNYEQQQTGSLWAGYNLSVGNVKVLEVTPMLGAVFGDTHGVAPGYEMSLTYKRLEISSQGEYVIDAKGHTGNFFYSWNELVSSPTDWFHGGLVAQRTRAYQPRSTYSVACRSDSPTERWMSRRTYLTSAGPTRPSFWFLA
jgi:hypothetical protein